jgi:hypothetical protein
MQPLPAVARRKDRRHGKGVIASPRPIHQIAIETPRSNGVVLLRQEPGRSGDHDEGGKYS